MSDNRYTDTYIAASILSANCKEPSVARAQDLYAMMDVKDRVAAHREIRALCEKIRTLGPVGAMEVLAALIRHTAQERRRANA